MNRSLKYGLIAVTGFVLLFLALVAIFAATFDPNDFKPQIIALVKEKKQRTLTLEGEIHLAFFPKLGIDLGKVAISEHNGPKEFAAMNRARLYLAWLPLLKKELVVDQVRADGLRANLVRRRDGTTNFDDLLKKEKEKPSPPIQFDIAGIKLTHAALDWRDGLKGQHFAIRGLEAKTGRLANARPTHVDLRFELQGDKPRIDLQMHLVSDLMFDLEKKHYVLEDLDAAAKGQAVDLSDLDLKLKGGVDAQPADRSYSLKDLVLSVAGKRDHDALEVKLEIPELELGQEKVTGKRIELQAKIKRPQGDLMANAGVPDMDGTPKAVRISQFTLGVDGRQGKTAVTGRLATPLSGSLDARLLELPKLSARLDVRNPGLPKGGMVARLNGNARIDLLRQDILANLGARLDESTIRARLGMSPFSRPFYTFDIDIDQMDVDRYMPPKSASPGQPGRQPARGPKQPGKPLDFSPLKRFNASGTLRIGSLKFANVKSSNLRLEMKAGAGMLQVSPLSANLYQGSTRGALQLKANGTPQVAIQQTFTGIQIGPLLKDAASKEILEGKGNVSLDLSAQGATVPAMKKALQGHVALNLVDGAIKGINLVAALRNARAQIVALRGEKVQTASPLEKTDFSELKATFDIRNGIAHNRDLFVKSPLLLLRGEGDIHLAEGSMNYLTRATVVVGREGEGGQEPASLKGVTVPVRATGPFSALKYTLDFHALAGEMAKQKLEEGKKAVEKKLEEKLKEGLKGLFR